MSSRKVQAEVGTTRGEDGKARETRLCFEEPAAATEDAGNKGALNENVSTEGALNLGKEDDVESWVSVTAVDAVVVIIL